MRLSDLFIKIREVWEAGLRIRSEINRLYLLEDIELNEIKDKEKELSELRIIYSQLISEAHSIDKISTKKFIQGLRSEKLAWQGSVENEKKRYGTMWLKKRRFYNSDIF